MSHSLRIGEKTQFKQKNTMIRFLNKSELETLVLCAETEVSYSNVKVSSLSYVKS